MGYCKIQWWRETHYKTKRGGCEWRAEQCRRTLASLRWHTSLPSCRIYPGALGLCSEKTQMAWGVLQLAAVGVPLSGPLERGKGWMNGGENKRNTERRPEGEQQVVPGSWANMWKKMSEWEDAVVHWGGLEGIHQLADLSCTPCWKFFPAFCCFLSNSCDCIIPKEKNKMWLVLLPQHEYVLRS